MKKRVLCALALAWFIGEVALLAAEPASPVDSIEGNLAGTF